MARLIRKQVRVCNTVKDMKMLWNCGMCGLRNQNGCGFKLCVVPLLKNRVSVISEVAEKDLEK